jgi:hypothetical protein
MNECIHCLQILETSEGTLFRLMFVVTYTLDGVGQVEEKILSRPFQVYSNKKKNIKGKFIGLIQRLVTECCEEKPLVFDMKPNQGPATAETEVWIKGRGFNDRGERVL